jgi:ABC-type Fe3+/spermidine/putrescine transport system ATPase subunit
VFIRPEHINFNPSKEDEILNVTVSAVLYDGPKTKFSLKTQYGDEILAVAHNFSLNIKEGDKIKTGINKNEFKIY